MGIINWREIEKKTTWAMQMTVEAAENWDKGAAGWNKRVTFGHDFTQNQVAALRKITKEDTVLDACCGAGRLTVPLAQKAKSVLAFDYGENMLGFCKANVEKAGLDNVQYMQGNWHEITPGVDFPQQDIAVACICPAHADIVKFSRAAKKYCYFLAYKSEDIAYRHVLFELFEGCSETPRMANRPKGEKDVRIGLNVPFNILYDLGANPTVEYAEGDWGYEAETKEAVLEYLATLGKIDEGKYDRFVVNAEKRIKTLPNGRVRYAYTGSMYVLGWDPNEINWDLVE